MRDEPVIIQGGMGVAISTWRLAGEVSRLGQLGVVSGTALDQVFSRRLQDGDPGGHMRRALDAFPFPEMARRAWNEHYIPGGRGTAVPYRLLPTHTAEGPRATRELCIVANFAEVFLARAGHANPVGINYLEKVQLPHLASLYGAMLAGVGYVLVGAGIPARIPGVLDRFVQHEPGEYPLHVAGGGGQDAALMKFSPAEYREGAVGPLARPKFVAIVSSHVLAETLHKKANGRVDGFVVEGPTAGGHNAPPRGKLKLDGAGEAIYGDRDRVDLARMREIGTPFWLAGGYGSAAKLREAWSEGAAGIQTGTPFAFCAESGVREDYKRAVIRKVRSGAARVVTDLAASPTRFPFKVVELEGSLTDDSVYRDRPRICDLGFLREAYRMEDGSIGYRCPAEPVTLYVSKGGRAEDAEGRKCLCNCLLATAGFPQLRNGSRCEVGLVTSGNDLPAIIQYLAPDGDVYYARDVIAALLADGSLLPAPAAAARTLG